MQRGMTRLTGQLFVSPTHIYFVCESQKGGLVAAIGKGVGGLIGGAISALGTPTPAQMANGYDEATVSQATQHAPGSLVMAPHQIRGIKDTFWTHAIWFDGQTYALPGGLSKACKAELGPWCQAHGVTHAGLVPKK